MNKAKVRGVDQDPKTNEKIYRQYLRAYKKGVFNFIKEDTDRLTNETIPRKYFSGGTGSFAAATETFGHDVVRVSHDNAMGVQAVTQDTPRDDVVQEAFLKATAISKNAAMTAQELKNYLKKALDNGLPNTFIDEEEDGVLNITWYANSELAHNRDLAWHHILFHGFVDTSNSRSVDIEIIAPKGPSGLKAVDKRGVMTEEKFLELIRNLDSYADGLDNAFDGEMAAGHRNSFFNTIRDTSNLNERPGQSNAAMKSNDYSLDTDTRRPDTNSAKTGLDFKAATPAFKGSILLPLTLDRPLGEITINGETFQPKSEFHATLALFNIIKKMSDALAQSDQYKGKPKKEIEGAVKAIVARAAEGVTFSAALTPEPFRLLVRTDEKGTKKSVIALIDITGKEEFFSKINNILAQQGVAFDITKETQGIPSHVTLFVQGDPNGIGLKSKEDYEAISQGVPEVNRGQIVKMLTGDNAMTAVMATHEQELKAYGQKHGLRGLEGRLVRGLDPAGQLAVSEVRDKIFLLAQKLGVPLESLEALTNALHVGAIWEKAEQLSRADDAVVQLWLYLAKITQEVNDRELTPDEYLKDVERIKSALDVSPETLVTEAKEFAKESRKHFTIDETTAVPFSAEDAFIFMAISGYKSGVTQAGDLFFVGSSAVPFDKVALKYGLRETSREDRGRVATFYQDQSGNDVIKVLYPGFGIVFGNKELALELAKAAADHAMSSYGGIDLNSADGVVPITENMSTTTVNDLLKEERVISIDFTGEEGRLTKLYALRGQDGRLIMVDMDHIKEFHFSAKNLGSRFFKNEDLLALVRYAVDHSTGYGLKNFTLTRDIGIDSLVTLQVVANLLGKNISDLEQEGIIRKVAGQNKERKATDFNARAGRWEVDLDKLSPAQRQRLASQNTNGLNVVFGSLPKSPDAFPGAGEILAQWDRLRELTGVSQETIKNGAAVVTMFPGKKSPRFPDDISIASIQEQEDSFKFWDALETGHAFVRLDAAMGSNWLDLNIEGDPVRIDTSHDTVIINNINISLEFHKAYKYHTLYFPDINLDDSRARSYGIYDQVYYISQNRAHAEAVFEKAKELAREGKDVYAIYKEAREYSRTIQDNAQLSSYVGKILSIKSDAAMLNVEGIRITKFHPDEILRIYYQKIGFGAEVKRSLAKFKSKSEDGKTLTVEMLDGTPKTFIFDNNNEGEQILGVEQLPTNTIALEAPVAELYLNPDQQKYFNEVHITTVEQLVARPRRQLEVHLGLANLNDIQAKLAARGLFLEDDNPDAAMAADKAALARNPQDLGGIDLNPANLNLRIKRDGHGMPLPFAQQDLAQLSNLTGLDPVILSIKPASQTPLLAELTTH